jgi:hypothetical protein
MSPVARTSINITSATLPLPVTGMTLGLAYDYTSDIFGIAGGEGGYVNAFAAYLMWQMTEKMKINTRLDLTKASNGWYYTVPGHTGDDELASLTVTADYSLWANVVSRLEFRWDKSLDGTAPYGGTVPGVPSDENAISVALNIIYKF